MVQLVEVRRMASPCLSSNSLVRKLKVNGSSMSLQGEDTVTCNEGLSVSLVPNHLITQEKLCVEDPGTEGQEQTWDPYLRAPIQLITDLSPPESEFLVHPLGSGHR
jgi:hypothetical protein